MDPLAAAKEQGISHVVLSRATALDWSSTELPLTFAPVVGGRTVWEAVQSPPNSVTLVEDPNYFGRKERRPPGDAPVWEIGQSNWSPAELRAARHLAASLRQVPGLKLPHGQPEAPWFIANLPTSAAKTAEALDNAGFAGCVALRRRTPEFPGGLRIEVAWPQRANAQFCTVVSSVI